MKKVFMTLLAVAVMGIANAQLFVGGDLSFSTSTMNSSSTIGGQTQTDKGYPKLTNWLIAPKIGFQTGKLSFGLAFGIGGQKYVQKNENATPVTTFTDKYTGFGAIPFFRYNVVEAGNLALFCELQVPIFSGKNKVKMEGGSDAFERDGGKCTMLGASIVPGLSYNFTDHLSIDVYIDILRLGFYMDKYTYEGTTDEGVAYKDTYKYTTFEVGAQTYPMSFGTHSAAYVNATGAEAPAFSYSVQTPIKIGVNFKF